MTVRTVLKEHGSALYVAFALGACVGGAADAVPSTGCEEDGAQRLDPDGVAESQLMRNQCSADSDCTAPGAPCRLCGDGTSACPSVCCDVCACVPDTATPLCEARPHLDTDHRAVRPPPTTTIATTTGS
jgi:hypothetical protein